MSKQRCLSWKYSLKSIPSSTKAAITAWKSALLSVGGRKMSSQMCMSSSECCWGCTLTDCDEDSFNRSSRIISASLRDSTVLLLAVSYSSDS